jgi:single-strand DNA-binding protein
MANDLNQCNFIGRLGADPETRYMASGDPVTNFRIACGWKTKDKEGAEWVSITAFGKLAEICGQYLNKGSQVFVSGRMTTEKFTDKNGVEKYSTKIIADRVQMLGKKEGSDAGEPAQRNSQGAPKAPAGDFEDDIPF